MRKILLLCLLAGAAKAQVLVNSDRGDQLFRRVADNPKAEKLRGKVYPMHAFLNLSLRFELTYYFEAPADQFSGPRHSIGVLLRVTPENSAPIFLTAAYPLRAIPAATKNQYLQIGGTFFLGPGAYTVDVLITDDRDRTFRSTQKVKALFKGAEKQIRSAVPPGAVASFASFSEAKTVAPDGKPLRLTFLLHAAPNYWRSTVLRPQDVGRMLGAMAAIIEQVNVKALRVVAFNLDQQREIYRNDHFKPESFEDLRQTLEPVQLGTVDVKVLQNRRGYIDLLADLIGRELRRDSRGEEPSDAVIVLGPTARMRDSVRSGILDENPAGGPQFSYLEYKSMRELMEMRRSMQGGSMVGQFPDTIESAVKKVNGKVYRIFTPGDFAKAIGDIVKRASG